ncbi:MAG: SDR family oxidoreductase [Pseudomonadota bacterium]
MTDLPAVLVTGGAKRIGRSIATDLAGRGYPVAIHANSSIDDAEALSDQLLLDGCKAAAVSADLMDVEATGQLVADAAEALGMPIRLLVNNASVFENDAVTDFTQAQFDRHMRVHVAAPAQLAQALVGELGDGAEALIVNIIDQRVKRLTPNFFTYTLSKSTQWAMTQTMAQALAPNVRVNAIGPGPTLKNVRQADEDFAKQVAAVPLRRGPSLDEFAATIAYFWEARSVTGQIVALDGGQHLAWETPDVVGINE